MRNSLILICLLIVATIIIDKMSDVSKYIKESFKNQILDPLKKVKTYPEIKDDKLFNDIIHYENDNENYGRTGLDKCIEKCNGTCVEYGPTGAATCFPKSMLDTNSYYDTMRKRSNEHEKEEITRTEKITFANMR